MRSALTIDEVRNLTHVDLIERIDAILTPYDPPDPGNPETGIQKIARLGRAIDELPAIYRWFIQVWSYCDHWTQGYDQLGGRRDTSYQAMRQKRDLFDKAASAAKIRWQGASRMVTLMESFDPTGMPRSRRID